MRVRSLVCLPFLLTLACGGDDSGGVNATNDGGADAAMKGADASPDAVARDASSDASDAAADSGPAPCPYLLCEDFESGTLGAAWKLDVDAPNTAVVSMDKAAHGKWALHAHVDDHGQQALIAETATQTGALLDHVFGREYFYLVAAPPSHTAWIVGTSKNSAIGDATERLEIGNYMGGWQLTEWSSVKGEHPSGQGTEPIGAWQCLQWELDNTTGAISVSGPGLMGGSVAGDMSTANWIAGGIAQLDFGILYVSSGTVVDAYVDDIAIDSKAVPCLP